MKKIFIYAMIAFVGIALMSCDKDKNNADDPQTNSKEYLQLNDLTPLHLIPLSQAEAKLKDMGFKIDGQLDDDNVYISSDKKETIIFSVNEDGLVEAINYTANKGITPADVKGWLSHIPERVNLPKYSRSIPFTGSYYYEVPMYDEPKYSAETYQQYLSLLENLDSEMNVSAIWEEDNIPDNETVGYGIIIQYEYSDNKDTASLCITCMHRIEPNFPE